MEVGLGFAWPAALAMFLVGFGFGVLAERTALCTMGAVADVVLFGGWRRARIWAGAVAVAVVGVQLLALVGSLDLSATTAWRTADPWLAGAGGALFGAGMVPAGGCLSRAWIRAASGSAKGVAVILAAIAAIGVTMRLLPMRLHGDAVALGTAPSLAGFAVAVALGWWVLKDRGFRRSAAATTAALLGALVVVAHLASPGSAPDGVRFVLPVAATSADGAPLAAAGGLALLVGVALGAALSAVQGGRWRAEPWVDRGDVWRHVGGGLAMGVGGSLAVGCTIGAGITGTAAMVPAAWLAVAGMVAGAVLALRVMLAGGPKGAWRAMRRSLVGGA